MQRKEDPVDAEANALRRRTHDHILPLRELQPSMENELKSILKFL
jgi:hypothetical protein